MAERWHKVTGCPLLEGYGLTIAERVPLEVVPNDKNLEYLRTKKEKLGHVLHLMS